MADTYAATPSETEQESTTARARYDLLSTDRDPVLKRGREASELTIPSLLPPQGSTGSTVLYQPFQSVGADGVNNLAAKLLLTIIPAGSSFFRLTIDDFVLDKLRQTAGAEKFADARAEFETALSRVERAVINRMEQKGNRMQLFEGFKHLLVGGNVLLQVLKDGKLKLHKLDRYVVCRDTEGNVLEIIVKETVTRRALPQAVRVQLPPQTQPADGTRKNDEVDIFTRVVRKERFWTVHQEVEGFVIPTSRGSYPLDKSPWLPLRFVAVDGEDYGRGYVEERIGDLRSLDSTTQSIVEAGAIMAKILTFVDESGETSRKKVSEARNGEVLNGRAKDVSFLQVEKFADLRVQLELSDKLEKRLQRGFLLIGGIQRDAERVTAEEIRLVANELETSLGGYYSTLSQELQLPLAVRMMFQMQKAGELPRLPEGAVSPQIVTGLAGLGRNSELNRLDSLVGGAEQVVGQEAVAEYLNVGGYLKRRAAALDLDPDGLFRSEQDVQAARQAQQQAALTEKAVAPGIKAMSDQASQAQQTQTQGENGAAG